MSSCEERGRVIKLARRSDDRAARPLQAIDNRLSEAAATRRPQASPAMRSAAAPGPRWRRQPGTQAALTQARSVFRPGGLPCISSPIRKTLAATHTAPTTAAAPTAIDSQTSHQGGGWVEAMRMSIA